MKNTLALIAFLLAANVALGQRIVLLEQFSNSGCPPCAASTPPVLAYAEAHPDQVVAITYHTAFPYIDSMYFENPVEAAARTRFYGIGGVPYSVIDGNYYRSSSSNLVGQIGAQVSARAAVAPGYGIVIRSATAVSGQVDAVVNVMGTAGPNDVLHIVAVEQTVLKNSYAASPGANTETEYKYVMRKMLTDTGGLSLATQPSLVSVSWPIHNVKRVEQIRIVAFVQNRVTKEVLQAVMATPSLVSAMTPLAVEPAFEVYPNPSSGSYALGSLLALLEGAELSLFSSDGRLVKKERYASGKAYSTAGLAPGLYRLCPTGKPAQGVRLIVQ